MEDPIINKKIRKLDSSSGSSGSTVHVDVREGDKHTQFRDHSKGCWHCDKKYKLVTLVENRAYKSYKGVCWGSMDNSVDDRNCENLDSWCSCHIHLNWIQVDFIWQVQGRIRIFYSHGDETICNIVYMIKVEFNVQGSPKEFRDDVRHVPNIRKNLISLCWIVLNGPPSKVKLEH